MAPLRGEFLDGTSRAGGLRSCRPPRPSRNLCARTAATKRTAVHSTEFDASVDRANSDVSSAEIFTARERLATDALRAFSSERRVGGIVAARTRSAMVAALGNMRVMEQINA